MASLSLKRKIPQADYDAQPISKRQRQHSWSATHHYIRKSNRPQAQLRPVGYQPKPEAIVLSSDDKSASSSPEPTRLPNYSKQQLERFNTVSGGILPDDSHQDDIIVNSIETPNHGRLTGYRHYVQELKRHGTYHRIRTTFKQYSGRGRTAQHLARLDRHRYLPRSTENLKPGINYDQFTAIPVHRRDNGNPIYHGGTYNPLIPLAIIRIAQKNIPFIDLRSALNHLPNIKPTDACPPLHVSIHQGHPDFVDESPHKRRKTDSCIRITYIPSYYSDGRHCIGYYIDDDSSQGQMLFTPCTRADLKEFGLVMEHNSVANDGIPDLDAWHYRRIAIVNGHWYQKENEYWTMFWDFIDYTWRRRLKIMMGRYEDLDLDLHYGRRIPPGW